MIVMASGERSIWATLVSERTVEQARHDKVPSTAIADNAPTLDAALLMADAAPELAEEDESP